MKLLSPTPRSRADRGLQLSRLHHLPSPLPVAGRDGECLCRAGLHAEQQRRRQRSAPVQPRRRWIAHRRRLVLDGRHRHGRGTRQPELARAQQHRAIPADDQRGEQRRSRRSRSVATERSICIGHWPSGGTMPLSVTIHGNIVYVVNGGGSGNISGFTMSSRGVLSPIAGSTLPLSSSAAGPAQISFSPNGRVLVVTEKAHELAQRLSRRVERKRDWSRPSYRPTAPRRSASPSTARCSSSPKHSVAPLTPALPPRTRCTPTERSRRSPRRRRRPRPPPAGSPSPSTASTPTPRIPGAGRSPATPCTTAR